MKLRLSVISFLLMLSPVIYGQNQTQAALLEKAYRDSSEVLLHEFFDNWSNEVSSNEGEAPNKWVAEAHKVFKAFYQPLQLDKIGCDDNEFLSYKDYPYFIVQDTLYGIFVADAIPITDDELKTYYENRIDQMYADADELKKEQETLLRIIELGNLYADFSSDYYYLSHSWLKIPMTKVDANITFRPQVSFPNKKIVYLTKGYELLLNAFLGDKHVDLGTESIMQTAYAKDESRQRMEFIKKAAKIYYGHWGGYWQYETYPKANSIIFDSSMQRAVVNFRFVYEGGEVYLEKQNDKWVVVSGKLTWIE